MADPASLTPAAVRATRAMETTTPAQLYMQLDRKIEPDSARKLAVAIFKRQKEKGTASIPGLGAPLIREFVLKQFGVKVSENFIRSKFKEYYEDDQKTPRKKWEDVVSPWKKNFDAKHEGSPKKKQRLEYNQDVMAKDPLKEAAVPADDQSGQAEDEFDEYAAVMIADIANGPHEEDDDNYFGCGDDADDDDDHREPANTGDKSPFDALVDDRAAAASPAMNLHTSSASTTSSTPPSGPSACSCKCKGIGSGEHENMMEFAAKSLRDAGIALLDPSTAQSLQDSQSENTIPLSVYEAYAAHLSGGDQKTPEPICLIEGGRVIVRSYKCAEIDPKSSKEHSCTSNERYTCHQCRIISEKTQNRISRASRIEADATPHPNETHLSVSRHPQKAQARLREQSSTIKALRAQVFRLHLKLRMEKHAVVEEDPKKIAAIQKGLETAYAKLDEGEEDESSKTMFTTYMKHFHKYSGDYVKRGEKRTTGMDYDPMMWEYAASLLAKTSQSVYAEIAKVTLLPSLSSVLKHQQKMTGKQNAALESHGVRYHTIASADKLLTEQGHKKGSPYRVGAVGFDSMTIRQGLGFEFRDCDFLGIDPSVKFLTVQHTFRRLAKGLAGGDTDDMDESSRNHTFMEQAESIAKHHLVVKWTQIDPVHNCKMSFNVASISVADMTPKLLVDLLHSVKLALHVKDFRCVSECGDGATENITYFEGVTSVSIKQYLPKDILAEEKYKGIIIDDKFQVEIDPVTHDPIIVLEDMPHIVKRVGNTVDYSSDEKHSRDLRWGEHQPINMNMIKQIHETYGENGLNLQPTALTMAHFIKDAASRMKVRLTVQLFGERVHWLLEKSCTKDNEDKDTWPTKLHYTQYKMLMKFILMIDRFVDLINGRDKNKGPNNYTRYWTPDNAREIQRELLDFLKDLWDFKQKAPAPCNFFADQTWNGLQRTILGYVAMIEYYVVGQKMSISPRSTLTDALEHHFSSLRSNFGSTNSGTSQMCESLDSRSDMFALAKSSQKGNNASAPALFERNIKNW